MAVRGKLLGAALGALAGPFGAAVGALLGHLYDRAIDPRSSDGQVSDDLANNVPQGVLGLLDAVAGLAAAAFRLNAATDRAQAERALVATSETDLGLEERFRPVARRVFGDFLAQEHLPVDDFVRDCKRELSGEQRVRLVAMLFVVADAEHRGIRSGFSDLLDGCALQLGLASAHLARMREEMLGSLGMAYQTLGIPYTANDQDVRRAYRRLAARFHPDRMGPSEDDDSGARFRAVSDAFTRIQDARRGDSNR